MDQRRRKGIDSLVRQSDFIVNSPSASSLGAKGCSSEPQTTPKNDKEAHKYASSSYFTHLPLPQAQRAANRPSPSLEDCHQQLSCPPPLDINGPQQSYGPSNYNISSYQDADNAQNPSHGPSGSATDPQTSWPSIPYDPRGHSPSFGHSDFYRPHQPHVGRSLYPHDLPDSEAAAHQQWRGGRHSSESRRPTLTQRHYDSIPHATSTSYGVLTDASLAEAQQPSLPRPHRRDPHGIGSYHQAHPTLPGTYHAYVGDANRPPHGQSTDYPQLVIDQPSYGLPGSPGASSFSSAGVGGSGHQPLSPGATSSRELYSHPRDSSPSAETPTPTEGSGDLESDQEFEPGAPTSTSTSTSPTSSSTSSPITSRWPRFHVPQNVFTGPGDAVRHELYHRIRREDWYINQTQERPITNPESSRIPGTVAGESVLLAFYDRETDANNKPVMRCAICKHTNQAMQLYPRPDRARVHMRHHFELRPVVCRGSCTIPHCKQRFFTAGDLKAHVTGKTGPLAMCQYCNKPLKSKNLLRHIDKFCHHAPPDIKARR